ncbi:alpha-D-ribose 1-methylphosphonate 5-phosphate C-P-lyase PhnJ [Candidatus Amarobacter glycogenicus]|uniref:alpha-D-ribose 1-methylphosphonate 5-phosphate C-P-lyase PhnJ n=1 Tax=Candidatus Amarobacter glycogenicus TaxID=3140699 RepID=UPI0031CCD5DC
MSSVATLVAQNVTPGRGAYNFGFLDETTKREVRRALLKAVALPGHQIPFGSREMPVARGWGTGGIQVTLSILGPDDTVKVIDQGADEGVNAWNIRRLVTDTSGVPTTTDSREATIIQTRHRIPETPLRDGQVLVFQVPMPEPLRMVEPSERKTRAMHAQADYSRAWVYLYEDVVRRGEISHATGYPVMVAGRYLLSPSPIPRWDVPKLNMADGLYLFGAGREKRVYAIPPHTEVVPIDFEDYPFYVESFPDRKCQKCGAEAVYMNEVVLDDGRHAFTCSDSGYCDSRLTGGVE